MSVIGPIVEYTEKQLLGFDGVKVSSVRRSTNTGPHILAREGASFDLIDFGFKSNQIVFCILSQMRSQVWDD